MSKLLAVAFPLAADKVNEWKQFTGQLMGSRNAEYIASRKRFNVRERTFHQQTPMGDFVIVTLEGDDPQGAFAKFGQGTDEFTQWFIAQVKSIHNMDLTQPPPGPMPELVVDSGN